MNGLTKIIPSGQSKSGLVVEVIDLVDMFREDHPKYDHFFKQAQDLLEGSFPENEREDGETILRRISDFTKEKNPDWVSCNLIAIINESVRGLMYGEILPTKNKGFVGFGGDGAVEPSVRREGIGKILEESFFNKCISFAQTNNYKRGVFFGEVEKPDSSDDQMRNVIRPKHHHTALGLGAAVIIDLEGTVKALPYAQPGISRGAPEVNLLACFTPFNVKKGAVDKMALEPGTVIGLDGKLLEDKARLPQLKPDFVIEYIRTVLIDSYAKDSETCDREQCQNILKRVESSLKHHEQVFLVPISDTKHIDYATRS